MFALHKTRKITEFPAHTNCMLSTTLYRSAFCLCVLKNPKCPNNKKEIYSDKYRHTRDRLFGLDGRQHGGMAYIIWNYDNLSTKWCIKHPPLLNLYNTTDLLQNGIFFIKIYKQVIFQHEYIGFSWSWIFLPHYILLVSWIVMRQLSVNRFQCELLRLVFVGFFSQPDVVNVTWMTGHIHRLFHCWHNRSD